MEKGSKEGDILLAQIQDEYKVQYAKQIDGDQNIESIALMEKKLNDSTSRSLEQNATGMKKTVGLVGGISLIVGTMIGSGIFASPSSVANNAGSVGSTLLIWCGSGLIAMLGALCYIELGTMIPKSGGEYIYYMEAYGDVAAFMFSYTSSVVLRPAGFAAISIACGDYLVEPFYGLEESKTKAMVAKGIGAAIIGNLT